MVRNLTFFPVGARADLSTFLNIAQEGVQFSCSDAEPATSADLGAPSGSKRQESQSSTGSVGGFSASPEAPQRRASGRSASVNASALSSGVGVSVLRGSKNGHPAYEVRWIATPSLFYGRLGVICAYLICIFINPCLRSTFKWHIMQFQLQIKYDPDRPPFIACERFDMYRKLFTTIYEKLYDDSRAQNAMQRHLIEIEELFPRTYKRQLVGIKLNDEALDSR